MLTTIITINATDMAQNWAQNTRSKCAILTELLDASQFTPLDRFSAAQPGSQLAELCVSALLTASFVWYKHQDMKRMKLEIKSRRTEISSKSKQLQAAVGCTHADAPKNR